MQLLVILKWTLKFKLQLIFKYLKFKILNLNFKFTL